MIAVEWLQNSWMVWGGAAIVGVLLLSAWGRSFVWRRQLAACENKLQAVEEQLQQARLHQTELTTRLELERQQSEEKQALLVGAREQLAQQFKAVAREIFDERGREFKEVNREELSRLLTPFQQQLDGFRQKVDEVYVNDVRERASLKQELEHLRGLNQQMTDEARQLTRALKGDRKVQGTWGELVLERLLEQSGLRRGSEYDVQGSFRDADNRLLRPDVILHLPEGKDVVIDSKVSLLS